MHDRHSLARDGGCTRPNCSEPGYHSEVHHSPGWAAGGTTDADTGRLAWTDGTKPPEINHAHHPEELLRGDTDPPDNQRE